MIKQSIVLGLLAVSLTGCIMAPFDDYDRDNGRYDRNDRGDHGRYDRNDRGGMRDRDRDRGGWNQNRQDDRRNWDRR